MGGGIGQRTDNLQLLDDRARPPMRDDERQGVVMFRANVNEMNVEPIDLGHEMRQGLQFRFALAPIVVRPPISHEFLHRRELHALRLIRDRFPFGPLCGVDASAEVDEVRFRNVDGEGADRGVIGCRSRMFGKQAEGSCCSNARGGGFDKTAAIMVDLFGRFTGIHR